MEVDLPEAPPAPAASGNASCGRGRAATGWTDTDARMAQDCVIASRLGGGGAVTIEKNGVKCTIEVKQSKDCVPEVVTAMKDIRLAGAAAVQQRQERWMEKKERAEKAAAEKPLLPQQSKSARKRARKQQAQRDRDAELETLRAAVAAAAPEAAAPAQELTSPPVEPPPPPEDTLEGRLVGLCKQALERISQLVTEEAVKRRVEPVARLVHLQMGEGVPRLNVLALAGQKGAGWEETEYGQYLLEAIEGVPDEHLEASLKAFCVRAFEADAMDS